MIIPTLNVASRKNFYLLKEILSKQNRSPKILCIGAGKAKGEGMDILSPYLINADIKYSIALDVICDAEKLSFKSSSLDAVILQAALEHIKNYKDAIEEAYRVLKDEGYIYAEVPFLQGVHAETDYRRFTLDGLKLELNKFKEIKTGICCGPFSAFVWIVSILLALVFSSINKRLFNRLRLYFLYLISPLKYFDIFFSKSENAEIIASAFYFLGKK